MCLKDGCAMNNENERGEVMSFGGRGKINKKRRKGMLSIKKLKKVLNPREFLKKLFVKVSVRRRISPCPSKRLRASMTVEAAFVLPFFLFAFLNIISILEIYRLQSGMSAAMHRTVKEMAVCAYEYKTLSNGDVGKAESLGLTYVWAANRVKKILGSEYLENSPIKGGAAQIGWYQSSILEKDDCIDLIATYTVKPPAAVVGFGTLPMYNRVLARAWTGYDNAAEALGNAAGEELVYITPDGAVYHRSRACPYLKLSIVPVDVAVLENERNEGGAKYYPCEECKGIFRSIVYITDYGTRYHSSLTCSKLKRTILTVPISQVGERGACSKCGG